MITVDKSITLTDFRKAKIAESKIVDSEKSEEPDAG